MWIFSTVVLSNLYSESAQLGSFDRGFNICKLSVIDRLSLWYRNKAETCLPQLKYVLFLFPCFTNISYESSGLRLLYYLCFEFQSITSTLHLLKMHQNSWSNNVLLPHYPVLKWIKIAFFIEMWWELCSLSY